MKIRHVFAACVILLISVSQAYGMEFSFSRTGPDNRVYPYHFLLMEGEIVPGDSLRLLEALTRFQKENPKEAFRAAVLLSSPGGDVVEALKIGDFLKKLFASVEIHPSYGPCVSACFLIYVSAVERSVSNNGKLGIHRPYLSKTYLEKLTVTQAEKDQKQLMRLTSEFLVDAGISRKLADIMMSKPSSEIYWLSRKEIEEIGYLAPWFEQYKITKCGDVMAPYREQNLEPGSLPEGFSDETICISEIEWGGRLEGLRELNTHLTTIKSETFLAHNRTQKGVKQTATGLQYKVLKNGEGKKAGFSDLVKVHYRGTLPDGSEFDNSYKRGEPALFKVNEVIPGWTEALQIMKEGGKFKIFVPAGLAYGEIGAGADIGPNQVLIFEIELLEINPKAAP